LIQLLSGGDGGHRKLAAFAIAQLGDEQLLQSLIRQQMAERSPGCRDAIAAAITTLKRIPASSGSTEQQRSAMVRSIYYPSASSTSPTSADIHKASATPAETKGFFRRLFGV
jgi:HEAT repeat protein